MSDMFPVFSKMVAASFQDIARTPSVFVANVDGDALYAQYLAAYPEGTNKLFRKNTEHDCSCCRHFIRRAGSVVDGKLRTVWDRAAVEAPEPYRTVAQAMRTAVREAGIRDLFRAGISELSFGAETTRSIEDGNVVTWNHFHTGAIPAHLRAAMADTERGDYRTTVQVLERGLKELTPEAVETVLGLIEANSLYRGAEHKRAVVEFQKLQTEFLASKDQKLFAWVNAVHPAARFRNTVIGTLVQDLSGGQDLEDAVKSFETKVAPQNYKRTSSLITPGMVKKAMAALEELGLEPALERRFAVIGDVSVNDVKWVDGSVKPLMKGGLGDMLMKHVAKPVANVDESRAEDISLEDFMARVLPETTGMEILFSSRHLGNLMSLTAPVHPEPKQLFRWNNDFAWSYGGNVADSITERVKKAGGRVDGAAMRVSLSWYNYDDLDLHVFEPPGRGLRGHIHFANKVGTTGGTLDVDMNAGTGQSRDAVENVYWKTPPPDGAYQVVVNNYRARESEDPGFAIELASGGKLVHYTYNKPVRNGQNIVVAVLYVKDGVVERTEVGQDITTGLPQQERWGIKTEQFVKVNSVMLSPNYWGENAVGNKHTFFVVDGAKNEEPTRGFYNEFLHPRLEPHRKVFEVIADKTKCQPTEGQLSGLGFSSTKKDSFIVRAQQGKRQRLFNVQVGETK